MERWILACLILLLVNQVVELVYNGMILKRNAEVHRREADDARESNDKFREANRKLFDQLAIAEEAARRALFLDRTGALVVTPHGGKALPKGWEGAVESVWAEHERMTMGKPAADPSNEPATKRPPEETL